MDAGGDAKGEHGGFHEAMIGATALSYAPGTPTPACMRVTALRVARFGGLIWLRLRKVN